MKFNNYIIQVSLRLVLILITMFLVTLLINDSERLFSIISLSALLFLLIAELLFKIYRTNRIVEELLESIRYGDYNKKIDKKISGLGFPGLADSAQEIIRAIASAKIEKEKQYLYLQYILEHINTGVLTLDRDNKPELINPVALNMLGLYDKYKPSWKEIKSKAPRFAKTIEDLGESGRKMIQLSGNPTGTKLLVLLSSVKIGKDPIRIITFQDINPEIEQKEIESWQTISRIMAHEIMNSLTPLASLTDTGIMLLEENDTIKPLNKLTQKTVDDLYTALTTISDRNRALTKFISNYRQLSRLPDPEMTSVSVADLINDLSRLYEEQFILKKIKVDVHPGPENCKLLVDEEQIKQVLINLVKNGVEALDGSKNPELSIDVKRVLQNIIIEISDNGAGIPEDTMERIFVPFFSTKQEGSGIGLSLSRQIVKNHGGQISVESEVGKRTCFRIVMPCEG